MSLFVALALVACAPLPAPPDTTDAPPSAAAPSGTAPATPSGTAPAGRAAPAAGGGREPSGSAVEVRPRFAPSALYSRDYGLGIGVGLGVRNLVAAGTDATADVRLQRHYQGAEVAFETGDRYARRLSALVAVGGFTTDRRFYAGVGPAPRGPALDLSHDAVRAEVGVRAYPLGSTAIRVQPSVEVRADHSDGVARGLLGGLDAASQRAVDRARGRRTGAWLGLEVGTDLRDRPGRPHRGLLAAVAHRRFAAFDGSDLTLAQTTASAAGYLPLGSRATAVLHGVGVTTRSGDADGDGRPDAVPFVYLPTLDDDLATPFRQNRLTGRDVLAVGAGVRATVADLYGLYGVDLLVMGTLGNAYDDVFDQFRPAVSLGADGVLDGDGRAALRPGLALGLGLADLDDGRAVLAAQVGVGPGGVTLATLRVAYDLAARRRAFR